MSGTLPNPTLTVYDNNSSAIANHDNWQDDVNTIDTSKNALAPMDALKSAAILQLPAGAYSAIVQGAEGGGGIALVEVSDID